MASSTSWPIAGCGAIDLRYCHRASGGTQKILTARYSSGSSGSAPCAPCDSSSACFASNASEMYFRKMRPSTTCLYSAASMLFRNASAVAQSFASNPRFAAVSVLVDLVLVAIRSYIHHSALFTASERWARPIAPTPSPTPPVDSARSLTRCRCRPPVWSIRDRRRSDAAPMPPVTRYAFTEAARFCGSGT